MTRDDGPWMCQAHPRPDQPIPGDGARTDLAVVAWSIFLLLLIVFLSSWLPDAGVVAR